jgi:TadE-like protein
MKVIIAKAVEQIRCFLRRQNGAALAELAILVPFLILLVAAISEFGRYFQNYTTLAKATRASARYLSAHTRDVDEQNKAKSLVVCGKLTCGTERLVAGIEASNVCIEYVYPGGSPVPETVKVSIPKDGTGGCGAPLAFRPVFNIGALLKTGFTFTPNISTSTTMYYMLEE